MSRQEIYQAISAITGTDYGAGMPYTFEMSSKDLAVIWDISADEDAKRLRQAIGESFAEIQTGKAYIQ